MDNICPICYNEIVSDRGIRGSMGIDENGDLLPFWTDDPLLTPRGLAGDNYRGQTPIRWIHIKELQDYYRQFEIDTEIEEPTDFSVVNRVNPIRRIHIIELRISVEKILTALDTTLEDYFKYDRFGNDTSLVQSDWTDIDRSDGIPSITKNIPMKALHIEELRRASLPENWCDLLELLNQKREDVGKEPVSVDNCKRIKLSDVLIFQSRTEEILGDYAFSDLAEALQCAGYSEQTEWSLGYHCKEEIEDILNLMYVKELSFLEHMIGLWHIWGHDTWPGGELYYDYDYIYFWIENRATLFPEGWGWRYVYLTYTLKSLPTNIKIIDYSIVDFENNGLTDEHVINQIPINNWIVGGTFELSPLEIEMWPTGANFPILKYAYHTCVE